MMPTTAPAIRPENREDPCPIRDLLHAAFPTEDEAMVVEELRDGNAIPTSQVAVDFGQTEGVHRIQSNLTSATASETLQGYWTWAPCNNNKCGISLMTPATY
jgi:hypothetical protein